jgi:CRP-like cAMP-binding protein
VAAETIRRIWPMASAYTIGRLAAASSVIQKASGALMAEGERPSRVGLVLSGPVAATWSAPDGRVVFVGLFGGGQFVGLGTLTGATIGSGVEAITEARMLSWPSDKFRAIADSDHALSLDLLDRCVYAIRLVNHLVQLRTFTTAASRLAGLLLQYEAFCFSVEATLVGRGQLSALAGVTPQMVSRILRRWEATGIVRRVGVSGLELLDRSALEREAAPLADFAAPDRTRPEPPNSRDPGTG